MALRPIHPGEMLFEDILAELGMSARQLAEVLGVPTRRVSDILRERRLITADFALRLSRWLGSGPEIWLNLQARYDLESAQLANGKEIEATVTPRQTA